MPSGKLRGGSSGLRCLPLYGQVLSLICGGLPAPLSVKPAVRSTFGIRLPTIPCILARAPMVWRLYGLLVVECARLVF